MFELEPMQLSGIQHFAFCRRQWALIHVEGLWKENVLTFEGREMHERAHDPFFTEKRGDLVISRNLPVVSNRLGITGQCDVVEFHVNPNGVELFGRSGLWMPCPVEYKRGAPKSGDMDRLQLCAQAICLEEMLLCPPIENAFLYYGETRRRDEVCLTDSLRKEVEDMFNEMRSLWERKYTPKVKPGKKCANCSMNELCAVSLMKLNKSVQSYIDYALRSEAGGE
ncbi:MAG: CRISPR-associated protein Cas4 [Oscillospiraceae bacterium]|jgi:CRISPR-associated exonuclease Cas4|nr:CRISPR-associated protein Cas4 [Oscillospiraceae bacterium]